MKKLLLSILGLMVGTSAVQAQQFVSTEPTTRTAVLEQYTGYRCTWCPAGSEILDGLLNQYNQQSIRLVGISIHTGSFATPQGSDPDFRTTWGNPMPQAMGATGFPAGSVNRTIFNNIQHQANGPAMGRGGWSSAAGQIASQASPVNVAVKAEYNPEDNKLYILTELYYTSNAATETHRLNVGIMQNDIWGSQTGAQRYPAMVDESRAPNIYRHTKVFRESLTGQWGEIVSTTTQGYYEVRTFVYEPETINGIPMIPEDLTVFAHVAESQMDIISGSMADVEIMTENQIGEPLSAGDRPKWFDIGTSTTSITPEVVNIAMYPNPVQDRLSIKAQNVNINEMVIFNMAGQQVMIEQVRGREFADFDVSALPAGVYVVRFNTENANVAPQKFVKK